MKKSAISFFVFIIIILNSSFGITYAATDNAILDISQSSYAIYIDDVMVRFDDITNITVNDIEMVPVKYISNLLNFDVKINDNSVEITNAEQEYQVKFFIGDDSIEYGFKEDLLTLEYPTSKPLSIKIDNEIYISCYDYCLVMNLKFAEKERENHKYYFYTREYLITGTSYIWNNTENVISEKLKLNGSMSVSLKNGDIQISINNVIVQFRDAPFVDENGRTQVPVRELCELLNKRVYWFENPQRVAISTVPADLDNTNGGGAGGDSIQFVIGENKYSKNGKEYPMDTAARIINNRTYIPLRIAGEFLNYEVIWQE